MSYSVERTHEFCYGHRVHGHESKCQHLHGHNGVVTFYVRPRQLDPISEFMGLLTSPDLKEKLEGKNGGLDSVGRVIDFSVVKTALCQWLEDNWDHRFLVWKEDPKGAYLKDIDDTVVLVPFNPTAENMAQYLVEVVGPKQLPADVELYGVKFHETGKCAASFFLPNRTLG